MPPPALLMDPSDLSALHAKGEDADELFASFAAWAEASGTVLYPAQEEALIEMVSGANVILATPTGSGKSLVATGALYAALAGHRRSFYTAPIKALVSEKFFALCEVFGAANVGMLTGDASVNHEAPIIACTAEVLANVALREGAAADIGLVVMTEAGRGRYRCWNCRGRSSCSCRRRSATSRSCGRTSPDARDGRLRWSHMRNVLCRFITTTPPRPCTRRSPIC
jgi:ATP-dependent helicase YprA (DUF1998 family)